MEHGLPGPDWAHPTQISARYDDTGVSLTPVIMGNKIFVRLYYACPKTGCTDDGPGTVKLTDNPKCDSGA